jgi:tripartite-type tricarboxylate transporter receptor subunit TctC
MWDNLTSGISQIRGGRVRALAVSSADRNPQLPDVPAARETMPELAKFDVNTWFGIFAPAATPRPVVDSINAAMKAWHDTDAVKARWREMGGVSLYGSTAEFAAFVANEVEKWGEVIHKEGLQLEVG